MKFLGVAVWLVVALGWLFAVGLLAIYRWMNAEAPISKLREYEGDDDGSSWSRPADPETLRKG